MATLAADHADYAVSGLSAARHAGLCALPLGRAGYIARDATSSARRDQAPTSRAADESPKTSSEVAA
jgi:hypothetical protein